MCIWILNNAEQKAMILKYQKSEKRYGIKGRWSIKESEENNRLNSIFSSLIIATVWC